VARAPSLRRGPTPALTSIRHPPPIIVQDPQEFWPRGVDGDLTLPQIQTYRAYLYQRLQTMAPDPRVSIAVLMAVATEYAYWDKLYNWKFARVYPRSNW